MPRQRHHIKIIQVDEDRLLDFLNKESIFNDGFPTNLFELSNKYYLKTSNVVLLEKLESKFPNKAQDINNDFDLKNAETIFSNY